MTQDVATWFTSWDRLWRILQSGLAVYVGIILLVRLYGKRTTSQMNSFDWIITVALGGLVSSGILMESVTITDALVASAWLMTLQWITTFLIIRSERFARAVRAEPTILVRGGEFVTTAMQRERISTREVHAALRSNGMRDIADAAWVILETDASFSVIPRGDREVLPAPLVEEVRAR